MDAGIATEANLQWLKEKTIVTWWLAASVMLNGMKSSRRLCVHKAQIKFGFTAKTVQMVRRLNCFVVPAAVFCSLKSELGMRPVYHQTTQRVEGHLWITLLAYHSFTTERQRHS